MNRIEGHITAARENLDVLCRDTLETPLAEVVKWTNDGEITVAVQELAAALDRIEQDTLTAEEARAILAHDATAEGAWAKLERIAGGSTALPEARSKDEIAEAGKYPPRP